MIQVMNIDYSENLLLFKYPHRLVGPYFVTVSVCKQ